MTISERRRKETEVLKERVLDLAEGIIATEGAQQVTMRRIAAAIDYAPTVLYRLFTNKNDLMDHLIARGYHGVRRRYDEILNRPDLGPTQKLTDLLLAYVSYAIDHPNHYRMWFETGSLSQDKGQMKMRHGRLHFVAFEVWLDCIEACREENLFVGLSNIEVFQLLWSQIHGVISLRLQHPEFGWMPLGAHLDQILDFSRMTNNDEAQG